MSRTSGYRLSVMIFGLAVCLILPACRTSKEKACDADEVSAVSDAIHDTFSKLNETLIPKMTFYSPATIVDAINFLNKASRDYAKPGTPPEQRGVSFVWDLHPPAFHPFAASTNDAPPVLAAISVRAISLCDALQLVCDVTDMKWLIQQDGTVRIFPNAWDAGEDGITRTYTVPQALADSLVNTPNAQPSEADTDNAFFMTTTPRPSDPAVDKAWKALFGQMGIILPKWTVFNYLPTINKLRVTSTPANLDIIDSVFNLFALRMIEVEMQIHAFRTADIEHLRLSGGVSLKALMSLRKNGKAKQVALAKALTKSGQEAIVKAVQEVIYPTDLLSGSGQTTGSNVTARSVANTLIPSYNNMRETGMILQVCPEVLRNGTGINLMLKPQWVTLEGWESYRADLASGWTHRTHSFKQPVFGVTSFDTQIAVKDGETVLVGSCSAPDGEWVNVGFLTTRFRDVQARCAGNRSDKSTSQPALKKAEAVKKMREIMIPEVTFRPPTTIIDAIRFFNEASIQYDKSPVPKAQRGFNFVLNLSANSGRRIEGGQYTDTSQATAPVTNSAPVIPAMSARSISLYDVLKLVCDITCMKFKIRDNIVWVMPLGDPSDNLMTRSYTVLSSLFDGLSADTKSSEGEKAWKEFFEQMGLNWPTGSSISVSHLASISVLRVTTTTENLALFEQVLEDLAIPRMVEVDVQIHAFRSEDIEQVRLSGDMSVEALMALRKKGKARQVASSTVLTKSGQQAFVKAVREVLYPTELLTDGGQVVSNVMSRSVANALIPGNFTMREAGVILQVVPEIATPDASHIHVTIKPQWVTLEGWQFYPAELASGRTHKTLAFKQPVFGTTCFETQVTVEAGKTILLGSSSTPDGKWVHVGFLTVK